MNKVDVFNMRYGNISTPQKRKLEELGVDIKAVATYLGVKYMYLWQILSGYAQSRKILNKIDNLIAELDDHETPERSIP